MNIKKVVGGICVIAATPIAVAVAANIAATAGAIAVVVGGLSEVTAISTGVTTMAVVEKATVVVGGTMIKDGIE